MKLIEVNSKKLNNSFHKVPFIIYKSDKNWIPNLKQDIDKLFNPKTNKLYDIGAEAIRWVLVDENDNLIGRVATFINPKTVDSGKMRIGGMGFFECINNQESANLLFNACVKWLKERGVEGMDGSVNFGERNEFWGLLIDNFKSPPSYQVNYNPPYYKSLFEHYGFKTYFNQILFARKLKYELSSFYERAYKKLASDSAYKFETIEGKSLVNVAEDFRQVYNGAWATHKDVKEMKSEVAQKIMQKLKPIIDPEIIAFVYYDNKPIAFFVGIPELNELFKYVNGNLNWIGKLKFVFNKWKNPPKTMVGIVFGVVKEFQGKGVDAALIRWFSSNVIEKLQYENTILTWIGDFNPKMLKIANLVGGKEYRKLRTYRYLFDKDAVFEKHPIVNV